MHPLVLTILLCGLALLLSYLVFLLPTERKIYTTREAFEHSIDRLRECISRMRRDK
jgi:hypothetical protein